eukprot:gene21671-27712_t
MLSVGGGSKPVHPTHGLTTTESFVAMQQQQLLPPHPQAPGGGPTGSMSQGSMPVGIHSELMLSRPMHHIPHQMISGQNQQQVLMNGQGQQQWNPNAQQLANNHTNQNFQLQNSAPLQQAQTVVPPSSSSTSFVGGNKFPPKSWHTAEHGPARAAMVDEIIKLLKTRRPNATDDWHEKLPHMAKRLEDALYHEAPILDEYSDHSTLKVRLQQLALSMGGNNSSKSSSSGGGGGAVSSGSGKSVPEGGRHAAQQARQLTAGNMAQHQQQQQFNSGPVSGLTQGGGGAVLSGGIAPPTAGSNGDVHSADYMLAPQGQQQGHPSRLYSTHNPNNPMMGTGNGQQQQSSISVPLHQQQQQTHGSGFPIHQQQVLSLAEDPAAGLMNGNYGGGVAGVGGAGNGRMSATSNHTQQQQHALQVPHQQMHGGGSGNGHSDEHRKQVLKQQQQRLLLLRHASKCPHDNGRCPVTPHCWSMKVLWKHIMSCKDQECKVPHCVSSRYVLSHYSKCKEQSCPVCGPVREAIKRNYERSRDVVKMTRQPNPGAAGYNNYNNGGPQGHQQGQLPMSGGRDSDAPPLKKVKVEKRAKNAADMGGHQVLTIPQQQAVQPKIVIRQKSIYPLDPISCAIYSFTSDQIASHFKNIQEGMKLTVSKIKEMCRPIMDELIKIPHAYGVFGTAVDPVALNLPDYFDMIKYPMDLGTVLKRLDGGSYRDMHNFVFEVHLTFDNAMTYNPKNSDVYLLAKSLKKDFDTRYRLKIAEFEKSIEDCRNSPDSCLICGEVSLKFEPPVYYCNGTCAQRIRRNAVFYSNATNMYHWCSACFNAMKENETIRLPDCTISRSELLKGKKKHTEDSEEGWVQCEGGCQRWVHQVCSLFNARRNISDDVSYVCPLCIQEKRRKNPDQIIVAPTTKKMRAFDLPVSTLSQFLEKRIFQRLQMAYEESAEKLGVDVNDVEKCPELILRQVSCLDKMHTVREGVYNRYKDKGYPTDFPCRTKCLVLFQNIDGQDVILFGMYVYEYGHKCPQPNQRRVYISYLDSVHYLRPKQYRTMVYHEILISYLDYVRARGFHTAHIWACPPQKGDDYILYVHPSDQKTPKPQILRVWYDEMLKLSKERGIVHSINDIHSEYLIDPTLDATVLPYFEGDYWVNEAEVIIKDLGGPQDDEDDDEDGPSMGSKKSKRKSKSKRPTRTSSKPLVGRSDRDPVMSKLASIIEPMKDTFFVARLHPKAYADRFADLRRDEVCAEASENTTESNDLRERQLQEEALSGNDVNMPAIPVPEEVKKEERADSSLSNNDGEEGGGNGEQNNPNPFEGDEEDEDDDFGRAASSISHNSEGAGAMDVALEFTPQQQADEDERRQLQESLVFLENGPDSSSSDVNNSDSFKTQGSFPAGEQSASSVSKRKLSVALEAPVEESTPEASTPSNRSGRSRRNLLKTSASTTSLSLDEGSSSSSSSAMDTAADVAVKVESTAAADYTTSSAAADVEVKEETVSGGEIPANVHTQGFVSKQFQQEAEPVAMLVEEVKVEQNIMETVVAADEVVTEVKTESDIATMSARKRYIPCGENLPKLSDDTEDVDDVQESEHFDTRQSFLNLCQGNHYQFDQLRRAKHTSMMVLYHLHNPDAPKFVPSCHQCHIDILSGFRHHCESCEIDFCHNCLSGAGNRIHNHPLRAINMSSSAPVQLTEEQRKERQRSIQLHMQLLSHAANCTKCESKNCHRMKDFLRHDSTCNTKVGGGCRLCARISNLLNIHARSCRVEGCRVPHCLDLREQIRKMTLRQQQMDDRRRKKMNIEYNRGSSSSATSSASAAVGDNDE